ncbi:hypothetical protein P6281_16310 [Mycobacterium sp. 5-140-3-2]|uniref:hypothetical protein n=1 Tax=Mycobacterium TaxID=1763 RepID=UPI0019157BD6|nr:MULTISPECIES: hypothetical protein [Mycobacterium]WRU80654.1 hypothetical protein P6281_16310 [Mycobacterium sp. 5-140-3-2]WSE43193.1 hypothetical protein QGN28_09810 [Mycobacterium sp. 5-140-3-1]WVL46116.1 hypothetical protein KN248_012140 [Mycobacterium paraintracellulare]BCP05886.1 hypothetical protein MINTM019_33420 [Mycobacterium paraintracellulare]
MPATLSQILAWSTEHLIDAAAYWTQTADRWEDAFLTMRNQAQAITWHGAGGDALRQRTGADVSVVSGKADQLRQAAGIARNGASDISAAQRRVLYGVEDAQNAGFTVGEDLSVTDTRSTSPAELATRQAQAEAFAADLRLRAEQLDGADTKVSGQLTAATAGLGGGGFAQNSTTNPGGQAQNGSGSGGQSQPGHNGGQPQPPTANHDGVRLVDFTQDNASGPNPPPFAPWDNPDGAPPPAPQPGFIPKYEQSITAPPAPKAGPPASPLPSPSVTPLPNPAAVGPAAAAPAKAPCSTYDMTKALLEPAGGTIGILTAVPEGLTLAGIPAALGQLALGTAAVADGLDAADRCLP